MTATATDPVVAIRVTTAPGAKASRVGEVATAAAGGWKWAFDGDGDGGGRVFLDVPNSHVEIACTILDNDPDVTRYEFL
jgi:hypothetical protein